MFKKLTLFLSIMPCVFYGASSSNTSEKRRTHKKRMSAYERRQLKKQAKKSGFSAEQQLQKKRELRKKKYLVARELYLLQLTKGFCNKKQMYAIEIVLQSGAHPNMPNARELGIKFNGWPVGNAALRGNAELTKLLIAYGADPTVTFKLGKHWDQAMHCAARGRHQKDGLQGDYVNTIYALFRRGANPSAGGNKRLPFTPLHFLAMQKRIPWRRQREIALALFRVDALPDKESFDGRTVQQIAKQSKLPKLAKLMSQRMQEVQKDRYLLNEFLRAFQQKNYAAAARIANQAKSAKQMAAPLGILDFQKRIYTQQENFLQLENHASSSEK